ncbi:hypothetical protein LTR65_005404 [Meristemomyces frigidus]
MFQDASHGHLTDCFNAVTEDLTLKIQALRLPKSNPAGQRLIYTSELLEKILLYLGDTETPRDLLLAQGVCKQFKAVIDGSTKLQRALFFLPDPADGRARVNRLLTGYDVFKIANLAVVPDHQNEIASLQPALDALHSGRQHIRHIDHIERMCIQQHPSTQMTWLRPSDPTGPFAEMVDITLATYTDGYMPLRRQRRKENHLSGDSWRRMYFSQPPMSVRWCLRDARGTLPVAEKDGAGRKFADLFKVPGFAGREAGHGGNVV